jgi:hypothetical protein
VFTKSSVQHVSQNDSPGIDEQLAAIIASAREVAIVAEELLREFSARQTSAASASAPHAILLAPRLLAATQQQLSSLLSMLRTM